MLICYHRYIFGPKGLSSNFNVYNKIYGSIGSLLISKWLNVVSYVLIIGFELYTKASEIFIFQISWPQPNPNKAPENLPLLFHFYTGMKFSSISSPSTNSSLKVFFEIGHILRGRFSSGCIFESIL